MDEPPARPPPPPPTKKPDRPKITLQIPDGTQRGPPTGSTIYWGPTKYHAPPPPGTAGTHLSGPHNPYYNPFTHMYNSKASDFMFKQFEGFKDFTMNTAKSGLSAGEKSAFWFYNKLRLWSKKWFTHFFLTLLLVLYSVVGALVFMTLEGPNEDKFDTKLDDVRLDLSTKIQDLVQRHNIHLESSNDFHKLIESHLIEYENNYSECMKHLSNNNTTKKTWGFFNSMFYAGTIYTTIGNAESGSDRGMSREEETEFSPISFRIPTIKADSETQTSAQLRTTDKKPTENIMDSQASTMNIRKRRTLSKNRGQTRQREKTPEPGRTPVPHEDTTTSDDEDFRPQRTSREIDADSSYEEMKRMVQQKSGVKDPVYDMDTDEILEARAMAANDRRRRSISPFAIPDKEETCGLQRKGSFMDPTNKLLSTTYTLSPKDEEKPRRNSLTIDTHRERKNSLTGLTPPLNASPKDKADFESSIPTTPKKLNEMVYPDEKKSGPISPAKKENVFNFEEDKPKIVRKSSTPRPTDLPSPTTGDIVTKVIQIERTPSRKLADELKPQVEVRQRVVRTPSRKSISEGQRPTQLVKREPRETPAAQPEAPVTKNPPVKPARRSVFGGKTSESEMSEDQGKQLGANPVAPRRRVVPTPRRFIKNRANRSQSVNRVEDLRSTDKTGTGISQTSREIIDLMEQARARSLSIPKDDPRVPVDYKRTIKTLATPNKTPTLLRQTRGISCPKTIQIISDKDILDGLIQKMEKPALEKTSTQSSGYIDASQSEYTSSCYSSSPSDNEYNFNLSEKTAELTRKLHALSQEKERRDKMSGILLSQDEFPRTPEPKSVLRKRTGEATKKKPPRKEDIVDDVKKKQPVKSRWKLIANWNQFKEEHKVEYQALINERNRCVADLLLVVIFCGLGGMMFKTLEGSFENAYKCSTRNVKRDFIENLWRGSSYMREEDWKSMARKKLFEFEEQLHTAHEAGVTSYSGQRSWNFMNSFVYCLTLISTIGYGHIAPKTTYGRVATIVYAIIGIPLFLIVLADFGKLFTRVIKFFWSFIRRFYYTRSCRKVRTTMPVQEVMKGLNIVYDVVRRPSQIFNEGEGQEIGDHPEGLPPPLVRKPSDGPPPLPPKPGTIIEDMDPETPNPSVYEIDDEFNLPISVAIVILVIYIIIGAVGYNLWETWNFFESFYFVFISMSTIGLGDLVPDHPMFMMASILYLVFGLALTSMCINVVQVKLSDTFKQASAKIGATIGLKVAEEDGSLVASTPPPTEIAPVHKPKREEKDSGSDSL